MKNAAVILALVLAGAACIPLIVLPHAFDAFRLPKELALRAEALLLLATFITTIILGARPRVRFNRWFVLPSIALAWMVITALTSTNPGVSAWRVVAGVATFIVYLATLHAAENRRAFLPLLAVPLIAAVINAFVDVLQELDVWMPFGSEPDVRHHFQCTAFIGNPNEIGSYLAVATLACIAAATADRARRKWFIAAAIVLVAGLVASQTLTALVALIAGAFALFALVSLKQAVRVAIAATVIAALLVIPIAPLRQRALNMATWLRSGDYNSLLTERLTPFVAATMMTAERPLAGVGPGAFGWNYFAYKLRAEQRYPPLRNAWSRGVNFGEVHDDHLQLLAETGAPGYAIFLAILGTLGAISFRRSADSPAQRFAMLLALPLAVLWFVLSLAQFPIETTAIRMLIVHFAALCIAWRPS